MASESTKAYEKAIKKAIKESAVMGRETGRNEIYSIVELIFKDMDSGPAAFFGLMSENEKKCLSKLSNLRQYIKDIEKL